MISKCLGNISGAFCYLSSTLFCLVVLGRKPGPYNMWESLNYFIFPTPSHSSNYFKLQI